MEIFLLEDDKQLNLSICNYFKSLNYSIDSFFDGKTAIENISDKYELFIIDINVPKIDGLEVLKYIKSKRINAKIFIISAKIDLEYIKKAYSLGCDDYIKKPFFLDELELKLQSLFSKIYLENSIYFDRISKKLFKNNQEVPLHHNELMLLSLLVDNINLIVKKEDIHNFIYNGNSKISPSAIRTLVLRLRNIIGHNKIENIKSIGYRLIGVDNEIN